MIAISLAPNFELKDAWLAIKLLFKPWQWQSGSGNKRLLAKLQTILGKSEGLYTVNSARWGLYELLHELKLEKDAEVLLQAFTCVSVPGPVLWNNLKPVYVDLLENELTMDPTDLEKKITPKSRVVIVQHTFGVPARMSEIMAIAKKHNLVLIEDCAHTIGGKYQGKLLGTIGDAAIYSFGRDKAVSSVFGGAVLVNTPQRFHQIKDTLDNLPEGKRSWIVQQLLHPILFQLIIKPLYFTFGIGKFKLVFAQKIGLVSKAIAPREKTGEQPAFASGKLPNALAELALFQLNRLDQFNARRQEIAEMYTVGFGHTKGLPVIDEKNSVYWLRYPIMVNNPRKIILAARREKMLLGDWYEVVAPKDADLKAVGYVLGACPVAESVAKKILNLPTYFKMTNNDVWRIVEFVKNNV